MKVKVGVGVTSVAGYAVTLAGVVAAVLAYTQGDRSEQTLGTITAGAVAAVAFVITQVGRYAQAHLLIGIGQFTPTAGALVTAAPDLVEPGDPDALPHLPVRNPAGIGADKGDAGAAGAVAA